MNAKQDRAYLWHWGKTRRWFRDHGLDPKLADGKRHELHRKALGYDKSHYDFNNRELTRVIGAFKAVYDGGNLNAQIHVEDDPEEQRLQKLSACTDAVSEMFLLGDVRLEHPKQRENYVAGTARKVVKKPLEECDAEALAKVLGCLKRRLGVMRRKDPDRAAAVDRQRAEQLPF